MSNILKRIFKIVEILDEIASAHTSKKTSEVEIVIRISMDQAKAEYPKGSITFFAIREGRGEPYDPTMRYHHFIDDVREDFDLGKYIRECHDQAVAQIERDKRLKHVQEPVPQERINKASEWGAFGGLIIWTDTMLAQAWEELGDIPLNYDDEGESLDPDGIERLDENFYFNDQLVAAKGTPKEDLWHWFDEMHSQGVGWLMHRGRDLD